jgi:hypothetical protein
MSIQICEAAPARAPVAGSKLMKPAKKSVPSKASTAATKEGDPAWGRFVSRFMDEYFALHPVRAVYCGRHEFDGLLPDWSEAVLAKLLVWLKDERAEALHFKVVSLSAAQRFERDYLLAQIDNEVFWQREVDEPHRSPARYLDALDPAVYLVRNYAEHCSTHARPHPLSAQCSCGHKPDTHQLARANAAHLHRPGERKLCRLCIVLSQGSSTAIRTSG